MIRIGPSYFIGLFGLFIALVTGIAAVQQHDDLAEIAGRSAVAAEIVSAERITDHRGHPATKVVLQYRPDVSPGECQAVRIMDVNDHSLVPGRMLAVLPRRISCYQPILANEVGDPRLYLTICGLSLVVGCLGSWRFVRGLKEAAGSRPAGH